MSWYDRRAILIDLASTWPGYGTPRLVSDIHVGRFIMFKKHGFREGFWPVDHPLYALVENAFRSAQKARTLKLPK